MESERLPRKEIQNFLTKLRVYFSEQFRSIPNFIEAIERNAKRSKYGLETEACFVDEFVVPKLLEFIETTQREILGGKQPNEVIRSGSTAARQKYKLAKIGGSKGHPFTKVIGEKPSKLFNLWRPGAKRTPGFEAWPDLALSAPYKIVFECKYFKREAADPLAKDALVQYLHEVFFYRGLPRREENEKRPGWDYDYSCLLAYDATKNHRLANAWTEVKAGIEKNFWDGGNIFVMVLPEKG